MSQTSFPSSGSGGTPRRPVPAGAAGLPGPSAGGFSGRSRLSSQKASPGVSHRRCGVRTPGPARGGPTSRAGALGAREPQRPVKSALGDRGGQREKVYGGKIKIISSINKYMKKKFLKEHALLLQPRTIHRTYAVSSKLLIKHQYTDSIIDIWHIFEALIMHFLYFS